MLILQLKTHLFSRLRQVSYVFICRECTVCGKCIRIQTILNDFCLSKNLNLIAAKKLFSALWHSAWGLLLVLFCRHRQLPSSNSAGFWAMDVSSIFCTFIKIKFQPETCLCFHNNFQSFFFRLVLIVVVFYWLSWLVWAICMVFGL